MCSQVLLGRARKIIPAIRISRPTVYLPEIRLLQHDSAPYPHREKIPALMCILQKTFSNTLQSVYEHAACIAYGCFFSPMGTLKKPHSM